MDPEDLKVTVDYSSNIDQPECGVFTSCAAFTMLDILLEANALKGVVSEVLSSATPAGRGSDDTRSI